MCVLYLSYARLLQHQVLFELADYSILIGSASFCPTALGTIIVSVSVFMKECTVRRSPFVLPFLIICHANYINSATSVASSFTL